jgi:hypothetical protein
MIDCTLVEDCPADRCFLFLLSAKLRRQHRGKSNRSPNPAATVMVPRKESQLLTHAQNANVAKSAVMVNSLVVNAMRIDLPSHASTTNIASESSHLESRRLLPSLQLTH